MPPDAAPLPRASSVRYVVSECPGVGFTAAWWASVVSTQLPRPSVAPLPAVSQGSLAELSPQPMGVPCSSMPTCPLGSSPRDTWHPAPCLFQNLLWDSEEECWPLRDSAGQDSDRTRCGTFEKQ